jgi:hypothetical protein
MAGGRGAVLPSGTRPQGFLERVSGRGSGEVEDEPVEAC